MKAQDSNPSELMLFEAVGDGETAHNDAVPWLRLKVRGAVTISFREVQLFLRIWETSTTTSPALMYPAWHLLARARAL
jgi:hypothetical protein